DLSKWYNLLGNKGKSRQHEKLAERARTKLEQKKVITYNAGLNKELKDKGITARTIKQLQARKIKPQTVKYLLNQGATDQVLVMLVGSHFGDAMMRKVTLKKVSQDIHKKMLYQSAVNKYIQDEARIVLNSSSEATLITIKGYEKKPILIATGKGFSEDDSIAIGTKGFSEDDAISIATKGFSEDDELSIATKGFSEDVFNIGQ
ncbi:MAG: hypothetical protein OEZ36_10630, partial [Spirochaetota bacterium]|nr:hypothetical protein [Spirochaetota bacterium]